MAKRHGILILPYFFFDPFVVFLNVLFAFFIHADFAGIVQQPANGHRIISQPKIIMRALLFKNAIDVPGMLCQSTGIGQVKPRGCRSRKKIGQFKISA